jgi:hypothetical protein
MGQAVRTFDPVPRSGSRTQPGSWMALSYYYLGSRLPRRAVGFSQGFQPISASLIKASTERMYFVPEGQHDRSQARSAWRHEKNSLVPEGRSNGSRLSLDANIPFISTGIPSVSKAARTPFRRQVSLTTTSTVPPGRGPLYTATQALRAWLRSACPSGTKAIRPSKGFALS